MNLLIQKYKFILSAFIFGIFVLFLVPLNVNAATWAQQFDAGNRYWSDVASSSDGTKLVAVVNDGSDGEYIYTHPLTVEQHGQSVPAQVCIIGEA